MLRPLSAIGRLSAGRSLLALTVVSVQVALLAGCGSGAETGAPGSPAADTPAATRAVTVGEATAAFGVLADLDRAWRDRDCARVGELTTWAERALSGDACAAADAGGDPPGSYDYRDPEFYLPIEDGLWFVAMARRPEPAYFLFHKVEGSWRLAAGPLRIRGRFPALTANAPVGALPADAAAASAEDADESIAAQLVPQRHLAYLTDPVGVNNITFPSGDPVEGLHDELTRRPARVRPDRLTVDVRLVDVPTRALRLDDDAALVFHALEVVLDQRAARRLARPVHDARALRSFTGVTRPRSLTVTEIVFLATRVDAAGGMRTVAMKRTLSALSAKPS